MSMHGLEPWNNERLENAYTACVLFAGYDEEEGREDLIYVAANAYWYPANLTLPELPEQYCWKIAVNTGDPKQQTFTVDQMPAAEKNIVLGERSVIVFVGETKE